MVIFFNVLLPIFFIKSVADKLWEVNAGNERRHLLAANGGKYWTTFLAKFCVFGKVNELDTDKSLTKLQSDLQPKIEFNLVYVSHTLLSLNRTSWSTK